ncbi:MAG: type II secretion system GspH family protein [Alicyclobacillus sp.]|nr:type II secretion system GspH family protein [Alicyclobacillus sp.]
MRSVIPEALSNRQRGEQGFTLMEMVIAVFIVSVMMAVLVPHLLGAGQRAEAVACEQDQRTIRAALNEYYLIHHTYPTGDTQTQIRALVQEQLLDSIPVEPSGGQFVISDADPADVTVSCTIHGTLGEQP